MDAVFEFLRRSVEELLARGGGPLHFRFLVMPTVVTLLAVRAGLRAARQGEPMFLWTFLRRPEERGRLLRAARKDIGRVVVVALVMDTAYQLIVLRRFHVGQALIVACFTAVLPYLLFRGPIAQLAWFVRRRSLRATDVVPASPAQGAGGPDTPPGAGERPGRPRPPGR